MNYVGFSPISYREWSNRYGCPVHTHQQLHGFSLRRFRLSSVVLQGPVSKRNSFASDS